MGFQYSNNKPIICAYYTDNYKQEIKKLEKSLNKFGLEYFFKRYESRGYWEANTRIKPEFLLECLELYTGKSIVYLDADAVVRKPLILFDNIKDDLGVYHSKISDAFSHKYLTGTLYLANNKKTKKFLEDWIEFQKGTLLGVDQDSFEKAIQINKDLGVFKLPESYVKIFDRAGEDPVIEHFQASRNRVKLQRLLKKLRNTLIGVCATILVFWFLYYMLNL